MAATTRQETAKVYMFPVRRRSGLDPRREEARGRAREVLSLSPIDVDAWYHQDAVRDVPEPRKG